MLPFEAQLEPPPPAVPQTTLPQRAGHGPGNLFREDDQHHARADRSVSRPSFGACGLACHIGRATRKAAARPLAVPRRCAGSGARMGHWHGALAGAAYVHRVAAVDSDVAEVPPSGERDSNQASIMLIPRSNHSMRTAVPPALVFPARLKFARGHELCVWPLSS